MEVAIIAIGNYAPLKMVSVVKVALVFFFMCFPLEEFGLGELRCFVKLFCRVCLVAMRRVDNVALVGVEAASLDSDDLIGLTLRNCGELL